MQKLNFILPKITVNKFDIGIIKQCIICNWSNIVPSNIINFTVCYKILLNHKFQLKIFIKVLSSSIIIVKMYEKEIINNIKNITKIDNIYIIYQQVLTINNDNLHAST